MPALREQARHQAKRSLGIHADCYFNIFHKLLISKKGPLAKQQRGAYIFFAMKLSPNTRYAIRILFELADASEPMSSAWLAEKTGLSLRVVETVQPVLKQQGITSGTVGAKGGVQLLRGLDKISLGEMIRLFDNGIEFAVCCGEKSNDCPNQDFCETRSVWRSVSALIQKELDAVSLETILRQYPKNGVLLEKLELPG